MRKISLFLILLTTLIACNKEQRAVNKLEGKWSVTNKIMTFSWGIVDPIEDGEILEYTFENCKVKKDDWCTVFENRTWTNPDGDVVSSEYSYNWIINENATKINWQEHTGDVQIWDIELLENKNAVISTYFESTNLIIELHLEKK